MYSYGWILTVTGGSQVALGHLPVPNELEKEDLEMLNQSPKIFEDNYAHHFEDEKRESHIAGYAVIRPYTGRRLEEIFDNATQFVAKLALLLEKCYMRYAPLYRVLIEIPSKKAVSCQPCPDPKIYKNKQQKSITMKHNNKELQKLKPKIVSILKKSGIKKAGIFGSYARGEQKKKSDIDILAQIPKRINLYDVVGIKLELEDALHRKVDLVDYKLIRPELRQRILQDEVRIL